jgi:purine-binding chemotaxis protein CheW
VEGLPLSTVEPLVKPVSGSAREFVRGQINLNGSLVILLDIDRLLASPEILVNQEQ